MAQYYKVQLDSLWLSSDGMEPIEPSLACRVEIQGLGNLATAEIGPIVKAITGKPWKFIQDNLGEGVDLVIKPLVMSNALLDDIITIIDAANASDDTVNLILTDGELPDRDLNCRPGEPAITYSGSFDEGRIYDVQINLTVDSIN